MINGQYGWDIWTILQSLSEIELIKVTNARRKRRFPPAYNKANTNREQAVRVATQYASAPCKLTISSHSFARCYLFRHVGYLRHQQQVDLWPFDLESGVRVTTCDVGYLCANFSLPRPLCSRVRPNVRGRQTDRRQTDVRQKHRLMPPSYQGGDIINDFWHTAPTGIGLCCIIQRLW